MKNLPLSQLPPTQPQSIIEAYSELTPQAFAAWIRLSVAPTGSCYNRYVTAEILSYSIAQAHNIIRELEALRYITKYRTSTKNNGKGVYILKKPIIEDSSNFVNLKNTILSYGETPAPTPKTCVSGKKRMTQTKALSLIKETIKKNNDSDGLSKKSGKSIKSKKNKNTFLPKNEISGQSKGYSDSDSSKNPGKQAKSPLKFKKKDSPKFKKSAGGKGVKTSKNKDLEKSKKTKNKVLNLSKKDENLDPGIVFNSLNLSIFKDKINKRKKEQRDKRIEKRISRRDMSYARSEKQIDWSKLDQKKDSNGNPKVTFSPSAKKREKYIEIFNRTNRSLAKQRLLEKFGQEFARIYCRYRRAIQKEKGLQPTFAIIEKDKKYTRIIAELCIRKEVTPKRLLNYWHQNIGDFTDSKLTVPPLSFLSSVANIDTVACSDPRELSLQERYHAIPVWRSAYNEMDIYDPRVRTALKKGGWNVSGESDYQLLFYQISAFEIAEGVGEIGLDADTAKKAKYLAKTLYRDFKKAK